MGNLYKKQLLNNNMEDIYYGFKKWQNSSLHWFTLVAGFALFAVVTSLVVKIGLAVFHDRPTWVGVNTPLLTVGKKDLSGNMVATSISNIEQLAQTSFAKNYTYFGFNRAEFIIDGQQFAQEVLLFDTNMVELLQLPVQFSQDPNELESGVVISHQFWLKALGGRDDVIGQIIIIGPYELKLPIKGIAPPSMDTIGKHQPAFWLPVNYYSELIVIQLTSGSTKGMGAALKGFRMSLAKKVPVFYAVIPDPPSTPLAQLTAEFAAFNEQGKSILQTSIKGLNPYLTEGLELAPTVKANIMLQWYLLLILSLTLGVICVLNLTTMSFSRLIARTQEFEIKIAVGANRQHILKQLMLESVPMCLLVLVLTFAFGAYTNHVMTEAELFVSYFGEQSITIDHHILMLCGALTLLIIVSSATLPMVNLLKQQKMRRSDGRSKIQRLLDQLNMTASFTSALVIITITISLLLYVYSQQTPPQMQVNVDSVKLSISTNEKEKQKINFESLYGQLDNTLQRQLAYANASFVLPKTLRQSIKTDDVNKPEVVMNVMAVSHHYFDVLGIPVSNVNEFTTNSVIVNQAALAQLGLTSAGDNALVTINEGEEKYRIIASVPNLPHFGMSDLNVPIVYMLLDIANAHRSSFFLFHATDKTTIQQQLNTLANKEGLNFEVVGQLKTLIEQVDYNQQVLAWLAVVLCSLLVAITGLGIFYQIKVFLLFERKNIGVRLAIGHQHINIIATIIKVAIIPLIISIPLCFWALSGFKAQLDTFFNANILTTEAVLMAFVMTLLLMLLAAMQPISHLFKHSIKALLQK